MEKCAAIIPRFGNTFQQNFSILKKFQFDFSDF